MIRVLNIISDTNIGGAGKVLLNYLEGTDREHFETLFAVPAGSLLKAPLEAAGGTVFEVPGMADRSYHRDDVKALRELISRLDPDIVHTHGSLSGRIAGKKCGKTVIYTRHSAFPVSAKLRYPPGRWLNRFMNTRYADHIIAVSPAAAENLTDAGVPAQRITTMMNGVSPMIRADEAACRALRQELGIQDGDFVMGIVARLEPYKGHAIILEALESLRAEGRNCKLLVAGTGSCAEALRQETRDRALEDAVTFLGFRKDVASILSILDLQLNASYGTEACSMSIIEGMSMGLPAVVSSYGGNPWLVTDGEDGLVFESRSAAALHDAVARLMDDRLLLRQLGEHALETYSRRFTAEIFARQVEQVYYNTWKGAGHGR